MPSDLELRDHTIHLSAADLMLEFASRRTEVGEHRRALTHDYTDGLTLNWARDYPGGITLLGPVRIPDEVTFGTGHAQRIILEVHEPYPSSASRGGAGTKKGGPEELQSRLLSPQSQQAIRESKAQLTGQPPRVDLERELHRLWDEVVRLREQVAELEARG